MTRTAGAVGTKALIVTPKSKPKPKPKPKPKSFMADRYFDPWFENVEVFYRAFDQSWTNVDGQVKMALDRRLWDEGLD